MLHRYFVEERLLRAAKNRNDKKAYENAQDMSMKHCKRLEEILSPS